MPRLRLYPEAPFVSRIGWLRAAVPGTSDGIVSTASVIRSGALSGGAT